MDTELASDAVIDIIASIEMQRREAERVMGGPAACSGALRSLQELLDRENAALQLHGPATDHSANVAALTIEIGKVTKMASLTGRISAPKNVYTGQREVLRRNAPRNPARNRGRRTMGRSGGR
jgi:hypothetical protein